MTKILEELCAEDGCTFELGGFDEENYWKAVINSDEQAEAVRVVAEEFYGKEGVSDATLPVYISEDFSTYLQHKPGCFFFRVVDTLPEGVFLHHQEYDFDDGIIEDMAEFWCRLVLHRCL